MISEIIDIRINIIDIRINCEYNFEVLDIYEYNLYNFEIMKMTHNIDIIILENLEYKKYIKIIILIIKKLL